MTPARGRDFAAPMARRNSNMSTISKNGKNRDTFFARAWRNADQRDWEIRWSLLDAESRMLYLDTITDQSQWKKGVPRVICPPFERQDLVGGGFLDESGGNGAQGLPLRDEALPFTKRLLSLCVHAVPSNFQDWTSYVKICLDDGRFRSRVEATLAFGGLQVDVESSEFWDLVQTPEWPRLVAHSLKDPIAQNIVDDPVLLDGFIGTFDYLEDEDGDAAELHDCIGAMILRGALFEQVDAGNGLLYFGFHPTVMNRMRQRSMTGAARPLVPIEPTTRLPAEKTTINDMRAILLEVLRAPIRLRADGEVFQKDLERLKTVVDPIPFGDEFLLASTVDHAVQCAFRFQFLAKREEGDRNQGVVAETGENWLRLMAADQVRWIFRQYQPLPTSRDFAIQGDYKFLLTNIYVKKSDENAEKDQTTPDPIELRRSFHRAFRLIPSDRFVTLESALDHLSALDNNPLLLGGTPESVEIFVHGGFWTDRSSGFISLARQVLEDLLSLRLLELGCFDIAWEGGEALISRNRLLDLYFGEELTDEEITGAPTLDSTVVVQPDFSTIILGNIGAVADFAPFTEPSSGHRDPHSRVLKLTRDAVVRAAFAGLSADQMVERLEKHATVPIPKNVLREIREWSSSVRRVDVAAMTVFSCPDSLVADRLPTILKQEGTRLAPTVVAFRQVEISEKQKAQLRKEGIHLVGELDPGKKKKPTGRPVKRRRR